MIPVLLMRMWILFVMDFIFFAACRTLLLSRRSISTKKTSILGLTFLIASITEVTLLSVRPTRMIVLGFAEARVMADSAPMPFSLGPVMTTGHVSWILEIEA